MSDDAQNEPPFAALHLVVKFAQTGILHATLAEFGPGVVIVLGHDDLRPLTPPDLLRERKVLLCQSSLL